MPKVTTFLKRLSTLWNQATEYGYYKSWQVLAFLIFGLPVIGRYMSRKWFWQDKGAIVLVYHELSATIFEKHLRYITSSWPVIPIDDLVTGIRQGKNLDNSVVITFDDGYKSNYTDVFPAILQYNTPVTIYLVSGVVGSQHEFWWLSLDNLRRTVRIEEIIPSTDYYKSIPEEQRHREIEALLTRYKYVPRERCTLSWQEVREMLDSGLVTFGSHTRSHPCLIKMSQEDARQEISSSKSDLESALGVKIGHFSYPNSDYNSFHISVCEQSGYLTAVTAIPGINTANTSPYQLRRILVRPDETVPELAMKMTGLGHKLGLDYFTARHLRSRGMPC